MKTDIKSLSSEELADVLKQWGEAHYRTGQLLNWLYANRATHWDAMSNLPRKLRQRLAEAFDLQIPQLVTRQGETDSTQKFLWRLADHSLIESVLIPANPALFGEPSDRQTLCISTQVGCAYGCKFCASGLAGWKRDLEVQEIVEQVLAVERWHASEHQTESPGKPALSEGAIPLTLPTSGSEVHAPVPTAPRLVSNLVIMGMGEPLANYENLIKALRILNAPWGSNIGARKMTISTCGLVPEIRLLAEEPAQWRLAISLHGATDRIRDQIMPINRRYPLRELMDACEYYQARKGRQITFEYILIAGLNDQLDQIEPLAELALRFSAKVNLIPFNPVPSLNWQRPPEQTQEVFLARLTQEGVKATLRREKGGEIDAACGQLRLKTEQQEAAASTPVLLESLPPPLEIVSS